MTELREALTAALVSAWYIRSDNPTLEELVDRIIAALPSGSWLAGPQERAVVEAVSRIPPHTRIDYTGTRWRVYRYAEPIEVPMDRWVEAVSRDSLAAAVDALLEAES